jgi:hypothetical protein
MRIINLVLVLFLFCQCELSKPGPKKYFTILKGDKFTLLKCYIDNGSFGNNFQYYCVKYRNSVKKIEFEDSEIVALFEWKSDTLIMGIHENLRSQIDFVEQEIELEIEDEKVIVKTIFYK